MQIVLFHGGSVRGAEEDAKPELSRFAVRGAEASFQKHKSISCGLKCKAGSFLNRPELTILHIVMA